LGGPGRGRCSAGTRDVGEKKALGMGIYLHRGTTGEPEGEFIYWGL